MACSSAPSIKFTLKDIFIPQIASHWRFRRQSTQTFPPLPPPLPFVFMCHLVKGLLSFIITLRFVILKINGYLYAGLKYACFLSFPCSPSPSLSFARPFFFLLWPALLMTTFRDFLISEGSAVLALGSGQPSFPGARAGSTRPDYPSAGCRCRAWDSGSGSGAVAPTAIQHPPPGSQDRRSGHPSKEALPCGAPHLRQHGDVVPRSPSTPESTGEKFYGNGHRQLPSTAPRNRRGPASPTPAPSSPGLAPLGARRREGIVPFPWSPHQL